MRDLGAIAAFFVGRYLIFKRQDPIFQTLKALSDFSLWLVMATIAAAYFGYISGASAYEWRGEFIPPSHAWLPYLLIANYALARIEKSRSTIYIQRIGLCVIGE